MNSNISFRANEVTFQRLAFGDGLLILSLRRYRNTHSLPAFHSLTHRNLSSFRENSPKIKDSGEERERSSNRYLISVCSAHAASIKFDGVEVLSEAVPFLIHLINHLSGQSPRTPNNPVRCLWVALAETHLFLLHFWANKSKNSFRTFWPDKQPAQRPAKFLV